MLDFTKTEGNGSDRNRIILQDDMDHQEGEKTLASVGFMNDESSFLGSAMFYDCNIDDAEQTGTKGKTRAMGIDPSPVEKPRQICLGMKKWAESSN